MKDLNLPKSVSDVLLEKAIGLKEKLIESKNEKAHVESKIEDMRMKLDDLQSLIKTAIPEKPTDRDSIKNPSAVALGRLGGLKGGKARAESLTKEQRSEAAKKAANARWKKEPTYEDPQFKMRSFNCLKLVGLLSHEKTLVEQLNRLKTQLSAIRLLIKNKR